MQLLCPALWTGSSEIWTPKGLGTPAPTTLLVVVAFMASLLEWFCSIPCGFSQIFHMLGFSSFLGPSMHEHLHSYNFMHCRFCGTLHGFLDLLKSPWPHSPCILHPCKTSTIQMTPTSATGSSSSQAFLHHGYRGFWVLEWVSIVNWIPGNTFSRQSFWAQCPRTLFLNKSFITCTIEPVLSGCSQKASALSGLCDIP